MSNKIVQLTSENVKRLTAVNIKPNGNLVIIGGKNGAGKSSVLDSICYALGGKDEIPDVPIHKGAEKAKVILELDDIIIKRTFTAAGTALVVENKDGAKYPSPQAILDKLTTKVTFDPLKFLRLEPRFQVDELRRLVKLDTTALDTERGRIYTERTVHNRNIEQDAAILKATPRHPDAPKDQIQSKPILDKISEVSAHNLQRERFASSIELAESKVTVLENEVEAAKKALVTAESRRDLAKTALVKANELYAPYADAKDDAALQKELAAVEETNRKVRENETYEQRAAALAFKNAEADKITARIAAIDAEKKKKSAETKYPIEGLAIAETGVITFGGLPLSQASQAEQMRISVAIAAAMNPKLRVMLIRDGSLVDEEGLALLEGLAKEFDLQIWIERVGKKDKCAVIIEDGKIEPPPSASEPVAPALPQAEEFKLSSPEKSTV